MMVTTRSNAFLHIRRTEIRTALPLQRVKAAMASVTTPREDVRPSFLKSLLLNADSPTEYSGDMEGNTFTLKWAWKGRTLVRPRTQSFAVVIDVDCIAEAEGTLIRLRVRQSRLDRLIFRSFEAAGPVTFLIAGDRRAGLILGGLLTLLFYGHDVMTSSLDFSFATDNLVLAISDEETGRTVNGKPASTG